MSEKESSAVRVIEDTRIEMDDGCSLAARIWMPHSASENPVPAVLEYIPYRKNDMKAVRDATIHGYFAENGYACVRVDLRGSGDSEGILRGEYLDRELRDGLSVIKWIAEQPWCTGDVGIFGLSWGGFNGLQLAALNPPGLKAIISVCSSDDRYTDDVHYMGGCLLTDNLSWASTMFAYNASPPDPAVVGGHWRDIWLERLNSSGLWLSDWLRHQTRDDFWKHASVCEDYSAIQCPVYIVSGWADGYTNTVFRILKNLQGPRKGLIGGWGHKYPHMGGPGPAIDFLGESLRWWDRWLKGIENGVEEDPMLQVWLQDSSSPLAANQPGQWIAESAWPAPGTQVNSYHLSSGKLLTEKAETGSGESASIKSPLSVGLFAGKWCSYAESTDLPWDQREEDGGALIFDSAPLKEPLHLFGAPEVTLEIRVDKPVAMVAVRLSDIDMDDRATRVTYGLLNLTHRDSHGNPQAIQTHTPFQVTVPMNHIAQRFPAGHRIRLAISTSYWPLAWPMPEPFRLTLYLPNSELKLPVWTPGVSETLPRELGKPKTGPKPSTTLIAPPKREWKVEHNLKTNEVSLNVTNRHRRYRLDDINLEIHRSQRERYSYINNNYDTVRGEVKSEMGFIRDDWEVMSITRTVLTSTGSHFRIRATLDAYEGDTRVYSRSWDEKIPRNMM